MSNSPSRSANLLQMITSDLPLNSDCSRQFDGDSQALADEGSSRDVGSDGKLLDGWIERPLVTKPLQVRRRSKLPTKAPQPDVLAPIHEEESSLDQHIVKNAGSDSRLMDARVETPATTQPLRIKRHQTLA